MRLLTHLLLWIEILFDSLLPKYKPQQWYKHDPDVKKRRCWAVLKRRCLFFYKPLTHTKVITHTDWLMPYRRSHEILMFDSEEKAESEVDRLGFGYAPIIERVYHNGELKGENYGNRKI
jgi:hypothetical protein